MARENNFLLGAGERLTRTVLVKSGGGTKTPPYDFATAAKRVAKDLKRVAKQIEDLPASACPGGEAVAAVTMHPRYLSKSDYPHDLLEAAGLHPIGSRPTRVSPTAWGISDPPEDGSAVSEQIFVAGPVSAFREWGMVLNAWQATGPASRQLQTIESIVTIDPASKLRSLPKGRDRAVLEIVLHTYANVSVVKSFTKYAASLGAQPILTRRRDVRGLTFLPVDAPLEHAEELARFAFVRVARGMPKLRPFRPAIQRSSWATFPITLPKEGPIDPQPRVVIFDGGLSTKVDLSPWATLITPAGIGPAIDDWVEHGTNVTGAFLFGHLRKGEALQRPPCAVDHVRVLDSRTGLDDDGHEDLLIMDVLDRITNHLDANEGKYDIVSLSIGPDMAAVDDDVTAWTAELDQRFAHENILAVVAAGNGGDRDVKSKMHRIQPPADCVNVLTVGAADTLGDDWCRAEYSSMGPGRNPGVVKPDGLAFGGSKRDPFMLLAATRPTRATGDMGTSFATPLMARHAADVRLELGNALKPLAVRALLIHRSDPVKHHKTEVGWGRFEHDPHRLLTCDDDEALVVYQGELPVGEHLRAPIPIPDNVLTGRVAISATLVIAPDVDPSFPGAYTRSGLEVSFRPHVERFTKYPDGRYSNHPTTKAFFSMSNMYGAGEYELREDACKWEPCLRNTQAFNASSLKQPSFDIEYQHRAAGAAAENPQPIPYALIVSVKAPRVKDLYNKVVRVYARQLVQLRPQHRLRIRR